MSQVSTIGLDIAKHVFHVHGADERGAAVFSRRLSRAKVLEFFASQPRCVVALEACGGGKGGYGTTVGETGPEEPGLSNVPPKHA